MDIAKLQDEIAKAKQAHESWKQKLRDAAASGTLPKPSQEIARDDQCGFGKWLHGLKSDKSLALSTQYRHVMSIHAAFHAEAGRIATMIEAGNSHEALEAVDGAVLQTVSSQLVGALDEWQSKLLAA